MDRTETKYIVLIAILLSLSFPPFPLGFLAPLALALFFLFLHNRTPREGFRLGYWLGLLWGAMTLFWIAASTLVGAILAVTINSLHYALLGWIFCWLNIKNRKLLLWVFPIIWIATEYVRLFSDVRFNWLTLAYTQTYYLPLIQIVEITGYLFISLLIIVLAEIIFLWIHSKKWIHFKFLSLVILPILLLWMYGEIRIQQLNEKKYPLLKAGLVQPNVDPYEKWEPDFQESAFQMLMQDSQELIAHSPDLIVWPETATPFYLRSHFREMERIVTFLDSHRVHLLTGTPDYQYSADKTDVYTYNAAFFFRPGDFSFESYYKMALVLGSETMPFKKYFPFLRKIDVGGGDFFPGENYSLFRFHVPFRQGDFSQHQYVLNDQKNDSSSQVILSAVICYESVFPHIVRQFIRRGANVLTIITNDGWFGMTSGPYQHAQYAVYRAIENRVSIIRCANTGISCFIDPVGRVLTRAELNTHKNLVAYLPLANHRTFYSRQGDWLGLTALVCSSILLLYWATYHFIKK